MNPGITVSGNSLHYYNTFMFIFQLIYEGLPYPAPVLTTPPPTEIWPVSKLAPGWPIAIEVILIDNWAQSPQYQTGHQ